MMTKSRAKRRPGIPWLIASALMMLSVLVVSCADGSSAPAQTTTATRVASIPTALVPILTANANPLNQRSGTGQGANAPTSQMQVMVGGELSGTIQMSGVAQDLPIQPGDNPYQLYFILQDAQGPAFLLDVYNYVGPGHYPLHGAIAPPHDDLLLWPESTQGNYYYMWPENYDTACTVDVNSDTASSFGSLHEIQGFIDCSELLSHNDLNSIVIGANFDVYVDVLA